MSVASSHSFTCIKLPNSSSPSSSYIFKFTVKSSQADGPIRRPVAPPVKPVMPSPTPPASPSAASPLPSAPPKPVSVASVVENGAVTMEFQRQKAKELQEYFKMKKLEEANQGPAFGFVGKNEISNGRYMSFSTPFFFWTW